jgi:type I restriction enzyme M protein
MALNDILSDPKSQRSLALFEPKAIRAVEALLTAKNGKHYLKCQVRNKEIQAKAEEVVRQLWIHRLLNHYQYPLSRALSDRGGETADSEGR